MQVVILCGGRGTRLAEETSLRPKPMVTVGGHPLLWHIMKIYGHHGFDRFTLATGHLGEQIKSYFLQWSAMSGDFEVDLATGNVSSLGASRRESWKVRVVDTGPNTLTGGRLLRLKDQLRETFLFTYGDGVSDLDLRAVLKFHQSHGKLVTVTAVRPAARFGGLQIHDDGLITAFREKAGTEEGWINGGFMVMEPGVFAYLDNDETVLEHAPMERLAKDNQLMAYQHDGFWQCMDTLRDRDLLETLWQSGEAPWNRWQS
jgi:glucose-1-phosphate cytidylyltransferase